jgi:hypothetical protein
VSFINSPSYGIAQYLSKVLMPATNKSVHKLKNTMDDKAKLEGAVIPSTHTMVSFDVKALFTSIPQDLAKHCVQ